MNNLILGFSLLPHDSELCKLLLKHIESFQIVEKKYKINDLRYFHPQYGNSDLLYLGHGLSNDFVYTDIYSCDHALIHPTSIGFVLLENANTRGTKVQNTLIKMKEEFKAKEIILPSVMQLLNYSSYRKSNINYAESKKHAEDKKENQVPVN